MTSKSIHPESLRFDAQASATAGLPSQVKFILQLLRKLEYGALRIEFPNGECMHFGDHSHPVTLTLKNFDLFHACLLYTSPSPRDLSTSRMPSSA